jgi:hypothetical protein
MTFGTLSSSFLGFEGFIWNPPGLIMVMGPAGYHFDDISDYLVNYAVLYVDSARIVPLPVVLQNLICRRFFEWVIY